MFLVFLRAGLTFPPHQTKGDLTLSLQGLCKVMEERWKVSKQDVFSHEFDVFADLEFELKPDIQVRAPTPHDCASG